MAANAREIRFADVGPLSDLFADRRDIHAVYARPASRIVGFLHTRRCLGARHFRRDFKSDARSVAPSETGDDALSRHRMAGADCGSADDVGDSVCGTVLAGSRWCHLYHWCTLFRQPTPALQSFHLAFVRAGRFELPFSRGSLLLRNVRGVLVESIRPFKRRSR